MFNLYSRFLKNVKVKYIKLFRYNYRKKYILKKIRKKSYVNKILIDKKNFNFGCFDNLIIFNVCVVSYF